MSENEARTPEKLDIISFLSDILNRLKRFWWVILLVTALFGALFFFRSSVTYTPSYSADATVVVELVNGGNYSNESTAELMSQVFPHLLSTGILSDLIKSDLNVRAIPGTIRVTNIDGTNLLTISVTGSNAENVANVLQSVLRNYPKAAWYVVGQTTMSVIDESGIPADTGRTNVVRGSLRNGLILGFLIGVLLLVIYTLSTRTIRSEKELRKLFNVSFMGTVPYYKKKKKKGEDRSINLLFNQRRGVYEEALRLVRTRVERQMEEESRVLMVTSSLPGEGKSTVAANLAVAFAKNGKRVILVDCDLRNPSQQKIFRLTGAYPGLEGVITGEAYLEDALVKVQSEDGKMELELLPGRPEGASSAEILGNEKVAMILEELKNQADLIILDTPPSAVLMDAMFMAPHSDGVVYVVLSDYARRRVVYRGLEELQQNGANILGCVLNGGRVHHSSYGYGSRYYSYRDSEGKTN